MKNSLKEVYKNILFEIAKPKLTTNINQAKFNHHTGNRTRIGSIKRAESALNYLQSNTSPKASINTGQSIDLSNYKDEMILKLSNLIKMLKSEIYINLDDTEQYNLFKAWRDDKLNGWSSIFRNIRYKFQQEHNISLPPADAGIFLNDPNGVIDDAIQYEVNTANMTIDIANDISAFKDKLIDIIENMIKDTATSINLTDNADVVTNSVIKSLENYFKESADCHEFFFRMLLDKHDSSQLSFKHSKSITSYSDDDIFDKKFFESGSLNSFKKKIKELFEYSVKIYILENLFLLDVYTPAKHVTRQDVTRSNNPRSDIHIEYVRNTDENGEEQKSVVVDDLKIEIKAGEAKGGSGTFYICFDEEEHKDFKSKNLFNANHDPLCTFELKSISGKSNISEIEKNMFSSIFNSQDKIKLSTILNNANMFNIEKTENGKVYYYRRKHEAFNNSNKDIVNFDIADHNISTFLKNKSWLEYYYGDVKKDSLIDIEGKGLYLLNSSNNSSSALDKFLNYLKKVHNLIDITAATDGAGATIRMQTYARSRSGMKWEAKILPKKIKKISYVKLNESNEELYKILSAARYFLSHDIKNYDSDLIKNLSNSNLLQYKCYNDTAFLLNILKNREEIDDMESVKQEQLDIIESNSKTWNRFSINMKETKTIKSVYSNLFKKETINEGIFHMMHPYEYHSSNEFKLGDLLEIINEIENGTLQASEKLDGQNLWFSFRDGNPVFAYNMKELQAGGLEFDRLIEPYEVESKKDIPKDFSTLEKITRPHVRKEGELSPYHGGFTSFKDGVEVIHNCLADSYSRDPEMIESIFNNGENFSSSEVIHAEGPNQILYGENFIAPHFVMDKSGEQYLDKYNNLFSILKFEQNKVKNPKGFKLLTRAQRNTVTSQIITFSGEKEKLDFVNDLREEYQKRIQSLINSTSLTLESTVKDFHRYHLVSYINSKGEQDLANNKEFIDSLLLFIHGTALKNSGLSEVPDYKKILKRLELGNAKSRRTFKSSYIGDIVEIFFDFGIDINRGIKTVATTEDSLDINHQRIVVTNLNNTKKAFEITNAIELEVDRLTQLGEEENPEHKKLFTLSRKLKIQMSKIKRVIKRVKTRKGFSSNLDSLEFIVSSSIEGLVMNRAVPNSDNVMELKLTGFFAPLNQVLNSIRYEVGHIDLLNQFLESDGQIFSLNNQNIPTTYDIESLLERKLLNKSILKKKNFSLIETYNLATYSQVGNEEFDISVVPMSAKPLTIGHEDLIKTACKKSKEVFVVISTTSRARSYENPVTGNAMERLYFEDNPSGFVPDLEGLLNSSIPECRGKVKVVYSKNPVTDVRTIFEEEFAYNYLDKESKYGIFVGDEEDTVAYDSEFLSHMGDRLSIIHKDANSPRLSSGTKTRRSLNTGRFTQEEEIPIKSKPGQTRLNKYVSLEEPYEEESGEYVESFNEFAANLSNIYSLNQKKRIYDYISSDSRETIDNLLIALENIPSNKVAKEMLSKEEKKIMAALGGFKKAKHLSDLYFNNQ